MEIQEEGVKLHEPNVGWTEALGEDAANPPRPAPGDVITLYQTCAECGGTGGADGCPCDWCKGSGKSGEVKETWVVAPCEHRIKAQFEQWVRAKAKEAVYQAEREDGPDRSTRLMAMYVGDFGAGHYNWDGRHCRSAQADLPGIRYLLYLLLRRSQPQATEAVAERIFREAPAAVAVALAWARGNSGSPAGPGTSRTTTGAG